MKILEMADKVRYPRMTTAELRETFLLTDLFKPGAVEMVYVDLDRTVIGGAVPTKTPLKLETAPELRADYFLQRREIGILNISKGTGTVTVGGTKYELGYLDCLYIGRGNESVEFSSADAAKPAEFYLLSYLAHKEYPTALSKRGDLEPVKLGASETLNKREIRKHIWMGGVKSCQLVMGFTELAEGSGWNTMPPHTHMRRSEVYLYFGLPETDRVIHLMGPPDETRHLIMADKQVVVSPGWSMHAGVGTRNYSFCWGMGGENQAYDDMDPVKLPEMK
ncbi:MAG TPA: 5-dehydro-4-deoxy-D-glucuronate isomerase [Acidobacteriaceae bacterium]|jgi:4-deoxy-L-threo-5-hexosulose-uronate ketol-isomerase|nr:5-dehydro-4-deoxy-D-glucuronate isomerase [Acidobacteriaceae bacterium]